MAITSKPTDVPEFARNDVVDPTTGQNNVVEPPESKKDSGWSYLEKPPRNWFNWLHRLTYLWIDYFNQFFSSTGQFKVDEIIENTTDNGVEIESVILKDGNVEVDELTVNDDVTLATGKDLNIQGAGRVKHDGSNVSGYSTTDGVIRHKRLNIDDWNMDSTQTVNIAHGLPDMLKIISINVSIINDASSAIYNFVTSDSVVAGTESISYNSTNISLSRKTGGTFDNVNYDTVPFNRGYIDIFYVD